MQERGNLVRKAVESLPACGSIPHVGRVPAPRVRRGQEATPDPWHAACFRTPARSGDPLLTRYPDPQFHSPEDQRGICHPDRQHGREEGADCWRRCSAPVALLPPDTRVVTADPVITLED